MAARLKVFVTSDGFTDYVVATTSKAKALAAWGLRQDVFKEGRAEETSDPELVAAATAQAGEVLRRPSGTRGELAKLKPPKKDKPAGPSKAALKKVADLEKRLAALDATHWERVDSLEREQAKIAAELESAQRDYAAQRTKVEDALSAARQALG